MSTGSEMFDDSIEERSDIIDVVAIFKNIDALYQGLLHLQQVEIIVLSSFITNSIEEMKSVIEFIEKTNPKLKIILLLNEDYGNHIHLQNPNIKKLTGKFTYSEFEALFLT